MDQQLKDQQAKGEFDVERTVEPICDMGDGVTAGHFRFDKRFHGTLDASSVVHMLAVGTDVPGSAAYVAIERLSGTLHGRSGTLFLQHNGVMDRGAATLSLSIVPDSGTDEWLGISGRMAIDITDGKHFYTLDYALPVPASHGRQKTGAYNSRPTKRREPDDADNESAGQARARQGHLDGRRPGASARPQ